jgi:hypothetical protein
MGEARRTCLALGAAQTDPAIKRLATKRGLTREPGFIYLSSNYVQALFMTRVRYIQQAIMALWR